MYNLFPKFFLNGSFVCLFFSCAYIERFSEKMNKSCEQFGIRVTQKQIQTTARILPPPCIQYNEV